jgi:hypothetical protein
MALAIIFLPLTIYRRQFPGVAIETLKRERKNTPASSPRKAASFTRRHESWKVVSRNMHPGRTAGKRK